MLKSIFAAAMIIAAPMAAQAKDIQKAVFGVLNPILNIWMG